MLRPLFIDVLQTLIPVGAGIFVFFGGCRLIHVQRSIRYTVIIIGFVFFGIGAASLSPLFPAQLTLWLSMIGGGTILLALVALLFLGTVWSVPGRSMSSRFLAILVGLAGFLLVVESSGWIIWRYFVTDTWEYTANQEGCLRQSSGLTCSPAAAVMLLHHYHIEASEGEMAYLANTSLFGTEVHAMARALTHKVRDRGWHAEARTLDYDACAARGTPFLAHIRTRFGGHAVFVEAITADHVDVIDPFDGHRSRVHRGTFEAVWQGIVIHIVTDSE